MNEDIEAILHREQITLASVQKRAFAFAIDEFLLSILFTIALWDAYSNAKTIEEVINLTNAFILKYITIKIIYQAFFVTKYGASLGKIFLKIKVIEIKTLQNPTLASSLNRAVFRIISKMSLYMGFLWGVLSPYRQTWHDLSARTLVVNA